MVMVSDGITEPGGEWLTAMLSGVEEMSADEIANEIIKTALNITRDMREDDMSVIAARIHRFEDEF